MQATMSQLAFNGTLGNVIKDKQKALGYKKDVIQAESNLQDSFGDYKKAKFDEGDKLIDSSLDKIEEGYNQKQLIVSDAKNARNDGLVQMHKDSIDKFSEAIQTLRNSRKEARKLADKIEEIAKEADKLKLEAMLDLKGVSKEGLHVSRALMALSNADLDELGDVGEAVKKARQARMEALEAVQKADKEIEAIKAQVEEVIAEKIQVAKDKRKEASQTKNDGYKEARKSFVNDLAKAREDYATALSNVRDAYRKEVLAAQDLLAEYKDLANADQDKAFALFDELENMKSVIAKINRQALYTRATNLVDLTTEALGLGEPGKGATKSLVNRIVRTLKTPDWLTTIAGKLTAVNAARLFMAEGDADQKTVVGAKVNMDAITIVNRTNDKEVLEKLDILDAEIDAFENSLN